MIFEFVRALAQGSTFVITLTYSGDCTAPTDLPWALEGTNVSSFEDTYDGQCIVRYRASQELPEYYKGLDLPRINNRAKQIWASRYRSEPYYTILYINGVGFE